MPELPEVETVCRGLEAKIKNHTIKEIKILNPKLRIPIPSNLNSKLKNKKILQVKRKAKYILIETEGDLSLIMHLGMSGRVVVLDPNTKLNAEQKLEKIFYYHQEKFIIKHNHLQINLDDGSTIIFNDTRKFGLVTLSKSSEINQHKLFCKSGIEPFSSDFSATKLHEIFAKRNKSVKSVLMDASLIVGIGNIYASEILFRSRIHPERLASTLSAKNCKEIHKHSLEILEEAIKAGGSTLKDYVHADGNLGYFQNNFQVYDRESHPCLICKSKIQSIKQNGRSTFFCVKCQK